MAPQHPLVRPASYDKRVALVLQAEEPSAVIKPAFTKLSRPRNIYQIGSPVSQSAP
jgi:hypothetical protein